MLYLVVIEWSQFIDMLRIAESEREFPSLYVVCEYGYLHKTLS